MHAHSIHFKFAVTGIFRYIRKYIYLLSIAYLILVSSILSFRYLFLLDVTTLLYFPIISLVSSTIS